MSVYEKCYVAKCPDCGRTVFAATARIVQQDRSTRAEISKMLRLGFSVERLDRDDLKAESFGHVDACKYSRIKKATAK